MKQMERITETLPPQDVALKCAGCGHAGRLPTIIYDRSKQDDSIRPLRPTFVGERTLMLCSQCRDGLRKGHRL